LKSYVKELHFAVVATRIFKNITADIERCLSESELVMGLKSMQICNPKDGFRAERLGCCRRRLDLDQPMVIDGKLFLWRYRYKTIKTSWRKSSGSNLDIRSTTEILEAHPVVEQTKHQVLSGSS
jgi:hypothetical protein